MKITYRGVPAAEQVWIGTCRSCGSKAEATKAEMTNITYDQREGDSFSWEACPVCGHGAKETGYGGMLFYPE